MGRRLALASCAGAALCADGLKISQNNSLILSTCAGLSVTNFEDFVRQFGKEYASEEYKWRQGLFEVHLMQMAAHNCADERPWKTNVNQMADWTETELQSLRGYRRVGSASSKGPAAPLTRLYAVAEEEMPEMVSYGHLESIKRPRDQKQCGSCWAYAAVTVLDAHAELHNRSSQFSVAQVLACTPNPQHCGGDGGCKGATAELAFQYVQEHGLSAEGSYRGYLSGGDGKCRASQDRRQKITRATGWDRLPENKLGNLLEAVAHRGPVVVSVDASGWNSYGGGVYHGCPTDATVNHAVVAVGFGSDEASGMDYWLIRNSWGNWGESGYIRLQRHASDEGDAGYCGTDRSPQEGVFCEGGPKEVPVCGMCGVLSDSSLPKGVVISHRPARSRGAVEAVRSFVRRAWRK